VAWANLFARDGPRNNTGKLLLAHATPKIRCDKALAFHPDLDEGYSLFHDVDDPENELHSTRPPETKVTVTDFLTCGRWMRVRPERRTGVGICVRRVIGKKQLAYK